MLHKDAGGNPLLSRRKMNIPVRFHPEKKEKSGREEKTLLRLRCVQKGPRCKSSLACVGTKEKVEWMQRGLSPARIGNGVVSVFINGIEAQLPFFSSSSSSTSFLSDWHLCRWCFCHLYENPTLQRLVFPSILLVPSIPGEQTQIHPSFGRRWNRTIFLYPIASFVSILFGGCSRTVKMVDRIDWLIWTRERVQQSPTNDTIS